MDWCEEARVDYVLGFGGNPVLDALCRKAADELCVRRAEMGAEKLRLCKSLKYAAKGWRRKRRVIARMEATTKGLDIRYVVTSLDGGPRFLYDVVYCARGEAENLIKMLKRQLAADRTSCSSPLANQVRLVLHTGGLLALALRSRRDPEGEPASPVRARAPAPEAHEDRGPRRRRGAPRPRAPADVLPRRRPLPARRGRTHAGRALRGGANALCASPEPILPNASQPGSDMQRRPSRAAGLARPDPRVGAIVSADVNGSG
jgi:hypothetical protein